MVPGEITTKINPENAREVSGSARLSKRTDKYTNPSIMTDLEAETEHPVIKRYETEQSIRAMAMNFEFTDNLFNKNIIAPIIILICNPLSARI